jgi:CheY-like chemotaxis protein
MRAEAPILLIEDDEVDILTVERALKYHRIDNALLVFRDSEQAVEYIETGPRPFLTILDLNMPRMNGLEVLERIRSNPALNDVPVIILTTSSEDSDVLCCYRAGIAGYFVKPVDYDEFLTMVLTIMTYWKSCTLPRIESENLPERR